MPQATAAGYNVIELVVGSTVETKAVVAVCLLFSLVSWYVIAVKWWEFRRLNRGRAAFDDAMESARTVDERQQAVTAIGRSPYAGLLRASAAFMSDLRAAMERDGVNRSGLSLTQLEALTMTLESDAGVSVERAGRMIPLLAVVAATSPLLGLFGTVLGIMNAFLGIANGGTSQINAVAPGIAEALIATAFGLGAAIPAMVAYNVFTGRVDRLEGELERLAQETVGALGREGRL
jgi:biopolymer transport protein TolQ